MAISGTIAGASLRTWARGQRETLDRLQRALELIGRAPARAHTVDDLLHALLLSLLRRHDARVGEAIARFDGSLARLIDDVDDIRSLSSVGRDPNLRRADLETLVTTMESLEKAEEGLRRRLESGDPELHQMMTGLADALPAAPPPVRPGTADPRPPREVPPLPRTLDRAAELLGEARRIESSLAAGTVPGPTGPLRLRWPDHPLVAEQMHALRRAAERLADQLARTRSPAVAVREVNRFRRQVATTGDTLRSLAERFEVTRTGDRLPPLRPVDPAVPQVPGSAAADALAAAARARALPASGATPTDVLDALTFERPAVSATGTLGEPLARTLPGGTVETVLLSPAEIRKLDTSPHWLARRLAEIVDGWERAHLIGPGFGGEIAEGLMLAPSGVNQLAQNRGIENVLRTAAGTGLEVTPTVTVTGRRLAIPLADGSFQHVDVMTSVSYRIPTPTGQLHFDVTVAPDGSWAATHNLPPGLVPQDVPMTGTR